MVNIKETKREKRDVYFQHLRHVPNVLEPKHIE